MHSKYSANLLSISDNPVVVIEYIKEFSIEEDKLTLTGSCQYFPTGTFAQISLKQDTDILFWGIITKYQFNHREEENEIVLQASRLEGDGDDRVETMSVLWGT